MRITFLGTGTSTGIPQIGCRCEVCRSTDSHDKRMRTSALISTHAGNILIDCGPDFRTQIIAAGQPPIDALLITHSHYDHIGGIDDLRPYCSSERPFRIYCQNDVAERILQLMPYSFSEHPYPGAPKLELIRIEAGVPFLFNNDLEILPMRVMHTLQLPILAYKIGGRLGYVTDCKTMPSETLEALKGIDLLVMNALRHDEHPSHMNLRQALDVIKSAQVSKAYLTHLSHQMGLHAGIGELLPDNVHVAYDGLALDI